MKKNFKEKDFQMMFKRWVTGVQYASNNCGFTGAFELKVSKGKTVPFSKFQPQQLPSLKRVKHDMFYYKLSDVDPGLKGFDCFVLHKELAYVVIMFNKDTEEGQHKFYLIGIDEVYKLKTDGKRSISETDCLDKGICVEF